MEQGLIVKAISGFYTIKSADSAIEYECKAAGVFRKKGMSPYVGDQVLFAPQDNMVREILPRKNDFVRPPLANLDQLFFVMSCTQPVPNFFITDKLIAIAEHKQIEPVIVITKSDLESPDKIRSIYQHAGFQVIVVNSDEDLGQILACLPGKISGFCGNTGVGKSTLLNRLMPQLQLKTGETSTKLGRGRHTTRHVELFEINGGYVADTPGFSTVDTMQYEVITKEELQYCFREFTPFLNQCKFTGCSHTVEKGCAVLAALQRGEIGITRHESYCQMYEEAKTIKEWELKK
ncbi:ribosome small subunit-dependent GTPase A [Clostridium facile]|uniref:Small ribosomal subunit biogenesis GTPase RsgA n=1 Tax=Clostridium facile TaxID=2763035 RepID=A0ABR7IPR8_9CLOT|nr:ribosome small subunit-dependent GTPase A [Clostridium facile]MBC5787112.1 ribosome small subunit-dependent GTPase A [Clostridium facile]